MNKRIGALALLAVGMAVGPLAAAESSGQDRPQAHPLQHDAAAIVKLIAVRVLGPDGRPVTGLRKEDFSLYEDGRSKPITEFEVHTITEAGMAVAPALPQMGGSSVRAAEATRRKLFFFLDQQGSDRAGKDKAKAAALAFLDSQVRPGDQVAVIGWYAMSGFYIREYLTSDLDRVRRAIKGLTELPPSAPTVVGRQADDGDTGFGFPFLERSAAVAVTERSVEIADSPTEALGLTVAVAPGTSSYQRVDFIPRLAEIAEVFKTIPGHKSLILFTARNMGSEAKRLGRLFGAAGTAVYAVNTQDWRAGPFGTKFKYIWKEHSLKDLTEASGGSYFADINDAAGIARDVQDLTGNYYVLGYYVQDSWEGKYHKVRVEVARPDARVLVQDGFADSKPYDQMSDFEKDIQLFDLLWSDRPSSGYLPLAIDPLVVPWGDASQACLLSKWEVGAKTGPPAGPVEVYALLRDGTGATKVSRRWAVDLTAHDGRTVCAYMTCPLGPGASDLKLVIRDRLSGAACVGRAQFDVAGRAQEAMALYSPLLFEEGPAVSFMKLPTARPQTSKGKSDADGPSVLSLYRLIPKEGRPVVGEVSPGARRLLAVVPFETRPRLPEDMPILAVEARLVPRAGGGAETPLEAEIRDFAAPGGGPDVLTVALILPDTIASGEYILEIAVEEIGTDRRAAVRKTLILR